MKGLTFAVAEMSNDSLCPMQEFFYHPRRQALGPRTVIFASDEEHELSRGHLATLRSQLP